MPTLVPGAALAVAAAALGLFGLGGGDPPPGFAARFATGPPAYPIPPAGSYVLPPVRPAPDGELLDEAGRAHRLKDLLGRQVTLVSFVYLLCGDVNGCPLALSTLFDISHGTGEVPQLKGKVQLMTISFDPARDTPEALASFAYPIRHDDARSRKIDWQILTARDAGTIAPILSGFGQVVDRSGDSDRLNHLLRMFLVDAEGRVRNIYGLGMIDPQLIMTDVETLLAEGRAQ